MTNNLAFTVELLGGSVVIRVGIDKVTSLHVDDSQLNNESMIRFQSGKVYGGLKFA